MPTVTFLKGPEIVAGNVREIFVDYAFDSSYPAGGEALAAGDLPGSVIKHIYGVQVVGGNAAAGAYLFHFDTENNKLLVFYPTGGVAPAAVADPTVTMPAGATPVTSDAAAPDFVLTAGRAIEIDDETDLSTLTVRLRIVGF